MNKSKENIFNKKIEVGRVVRYVPYKDCSDEEIEYGTITSYKEGSNLVFVQYKGDVNSKATNIRDIIVLG